MMAVLLPALVLCRMHGAWMQIGLAATLATLMLLLGLPHATHALTKDGSIYVTKDATALANGLVNSSTFTLLTAAYTQVSQPAGIITWGTSTPREGWHLARIHLDKFNPKGVVVFSTGDVRRTIITGGETLPSPPPLYPTEFTNTKISNARDMAVLDMTLRAKINGYLVRLWMIGRVLLAVANQLVALTACVCARFTSCCTLLPTTP
jgi:hypothetical protein